MTKEALQIEYDEIRQLIKQELQAINMNAELIGLSKAAIAKYGEQLEELQKKYSKIEDKKND